MHKFKITLVILVIFNGAVISQEKRDIGVQLGGSYYVGDYNLGKPFYQPSTALGVIFKYNINEFYTARLSAAYGGLKGTYSSSQLFLPGLTRTFNKKLLEFETMAEFNFLAFDTRQYKKQNFSPYFIMGLGFAYIGNQIIPHLPFGAGVKISAGSRTAIRFEWRMHKTLTDSLDDYENLDDGTNAFLHNNDWFSFVGLFLTYRLYNYGYTCPAYR